MDFQQVLIGLHRERHRLDQAIAALEELSSRRASQRGRPRGAKPAKSAATRKTGGITAAGRRRLSEMMKKRWAERKKKAAPTRKAMSAASRKRLSEMMKKRWLERKAKKG